MIADFMNSLFNSGILLTGSAGVLVVVWVFIRRIVTKSTKEVTKDEAEVDILKMWKEERDSFKQLTEALQKERTELLIKLANLEHQLKAVQLQLDVLIKEKSELVQRIELEENRCRDCKFRFHEE